MKRKSMKEMEELNSNNLLSKSTVVRGDIETFGNLRVEGKFYGNIVTKMKFVSGSSSLVEGNIDAQNAEISGHVKGGALNIEKRLTLTSTARIESDINTAELLIEPGAVFFGNCQMKSKEAELKLNVTEEKKEISM